MVQFRLRGLRGNVRLVNTSDGSRSIEGLTSVESPGVTRADLRLVVGEQSGHPRRPAVRPMMSIRSVLRGGPTQREPRTGDGRGPLGWLGPAVWVAAMLACGIGALTVRDSMFPRLGASDAPSVWQTPSDSAPSTTLETAVATSAAASSVTAVASDLEAASSPDGDRSSVVIADAVVPAASARSTALGLSTVPGSVTTPPTTAIAASTSALTTTPATTTPEITVPAVSTSIPGGRPETPSTTSPKEISTSSLPSTESRAQLAASTNRTTTSTTSSSGSAGSVSVNSGSGSSGSGPGSSGSGSGDSGSSGHGGK